MMDDLWLTLVTAIFIVESWTVYLFTRNIWYVSNVKEVPREMISLITYEDLQRLREIAVLHSLYEVLDDLFSFGVNLAKMLFGYHPYVWALTADYGESLATRTVLFFGLDVFLSSSVFTIVAVLSALISYDPQVNPFLLLISMTVMSAINSVIAAAGAFGLIYLTDKFGPEGYITLIVSANILGLLTYDFFISQIIPKLSRPLQDGPAGFSIIALARRVGFPHDRIHVNPDPTARPNASYSCGLRSEMILITQNMTEILQPEQLTSVVAHELGHWHLHHSNIQYILDGIELAVLCYMWRWAYANKLLNRLFSLHGETHPLVPVYLFTYYILPVFLDVYNGFESMIKRRCEFKADDYCSKLGYSSSLKEALLILAAKTNSLPLLDNWYSAWFLGYPTVLERVRRIDNTSPHLTPT